MRVHVGQLGLRLLDSGARGGDILLLRFCRAHRAFRFARRNRIALQQILLPLRVGLQEFQLRALRLDVVLRRVDLRCGQGATRLQFGRFELHDRIAGFQSVAFPRENFLDSSPGTRSDMNFIYLDCAGDGIALAAAAGQEGDRADGNGERETHQKLGDIMCSKP